MIVSSLHSWRVYCELSAVEAQPGFFQEMQSQGSTTADRSQHLNPKAPSLRGIAVVLSTIHAQLGMGERIPVVDSVDPIHSPKKILVNPLPQVRLRMCQGLSSLNPKPTCELQALVRDSPGCWSSANYPHLQHPHEWTSKAGIRVQGLGFRV